MRACTCPVSGHDVVVLTSAGCVRLLISGLWFTPGILYVAFLNEFQQTAGVTSWITTLQYFSSCIMCVIGGLLVKRLGYRLVTISGGIMLFAGLLTSMWASHIVHIFLSYGVLSGLGSGLAYIGSMEALNLQINKYRNVLFGLCAFTGNLGIMLYPPLLQTLIDRYTWRGMFLVLAAFELNIVAVALVRVSKRRVSMTVEHRIGEDEEKDEDEDEEEGEGEGERIVGEKTLLNGRFDVKNRVAVVESEREKRVVCCEEGKMLSRSGEYIEGKDEYCVHDKPFVEIVNGPTNDGMVEGEVGRKQVVSVGNVDETFYHKSDNECCNGDHEHDDQSASVRDVVASPEDNIDETILNSANKNRLDNPQNVSDDEIAIRDYANEEMSFQNDGGDILLNKNNDYKADVVHSFVERKNIFNLDNSNNRVAMFSQDGVRERLPNKNSSTFNGKQICKEQTSDRSDAKSIDSKHEFKIIGDAKVKTGSFLDENSFLKDVHFSLYLLSGTLFLFGTSIVLGHLSAYIVRHKLSDKLGASMVYTVNALTMAVAKLLQGFLIGDNRLQPSTLHALLTGTGGLASFIFLFELSLPVVYTYVIVFGACNSAVGGALMPAMITKMAERQCFAFALGLTACATAVGSLLGAPVAGWIFDSTQSYTMPFLVSAIAMMSASAVMLASIWMKRISNSRANSRAIS